MAEPTTKRAPARAARARKATAASVRPAAAEPSPPLPRGRTEPISAKEADRLLADGVALFNASRYWHAHEVWETVWRAAPNEERDFYQGLIQVAAGLLHLQRRNGRGARNKLAEGLAKLQPYQPVFQGLFVNELIGKATLILEDLQSGQLPYLIPPVIRMVDR